MLRLVMRVVLITLGLLVGSVMLIVAQPYDDGSVRGVLMPQDCPMPCFLGIQPGKTPIYDAIDLLEKSGWAQDVEVQRNIAGWVEQVLWTWNGTQSSIYASQSKNRIAVSHSIQTSPQLVTSVTVSTTIPVAYAYLLLGDTYLTDSRREEGQLGARVSAFYIGPFVNIWSVIECPGTKERFWEAPMSIEFMSGDALPGRFSSIGFYCYASGQNRGT